jgi:micrococcal nuclease
VRVAAQRERVRYIGIDTPESYPGRVSECYAEEAKLANEQLVAGKVVQLVADRTDRDDYDRLLRYIYVDDLLVNAALVRDGYARVLPIPPNVRFAEALSQAAQTAQAENRGLWNACD